MPGSDLALLVDAARQAGEIAKRYAGPSARQWDKPDDAGPVTEADLAVNDLLHDVLRSARPDYGWLSEETEDNEDRLSQDTVFIVDPIDGTRSFIDGSRTWAHSLAVVHKGQATAGVVYLPQRDMLYAAAIGEGAELNGETITVSETARIPNAEVLAARPMMEASRWRKGAPQMKRSYRPSLAYRLALVAEGRYDAMITLRDTWEWDVAAGAVILSEAGAAVSDKTGAAPRFNNPRPALSGLITAAPGLHGEILALEPK